MPEGTDTHPRLRPEDSVALRVAVAAAVTLGVLALLAQDVVDTTVALAALIGAPIGSYVSWRRRSRKQVAVKVALAAGLLVAFAGFLRGVGGATTIDDTRVPLAELFLWVQTLHAFDQPRRKDLQFSLASSITLVALAGSLSQETWFGVFFVAWGLAALAALALSHRSEVREKAAGSVPATGNGPNRFKAYSLRGGVATLTVIVIASSVVFMFTPRGRGTQLGSLPFRIPDILRNAEGGVVNVGLPNQEAPGDDPAVPAADSYFGFANFVDLRVRGTLGDELVMRVRAPEPAFWRGPVFDTYSNSAWTVSDPTTRSMGGDPAFLPAEPPAVPSVDMTQTFYVERGQTNVIFAAYQPVEIWFPGSLEVAGTRAMRAPFILDEGLVYSVVSQRPVINDAKLASRPDEIPKRILDAYSQVPANLPPRVASLAQEIAGDQPTIIGKARAVEDWLARNTRYLLEIPPQPPGSDAVDHFLFEDRRGFCEQIASSMAVLLRTLGVPTRFVTGYDAGDRNAFSGYFEVRGHHAHSWVEVYFPEAGWLEFDPTHEVPAAHANRSGRLPGLEFLGKVSSFLGGLLPDDLANRVGAALKDALGWVASNGIRAGMLVVGLAALVASATFAGRRTARAVRRRRLRRPIRGRPGEVVVKAFRILEEAGAEAGVPRHSAATPQEYGRALLRSRPSLDPRGLRTVIEMLERQVYAGESLGPGDAARAEEEARRLSAALAVPEANAVR